MPTWPSRPTVLASLVTQKRPQLAVDAGQLTLGAHDGVDVLVGRRRLVATTRLIYPAAVGGDIGCGMAAVAVDADAGLLDGERTAARLLNALGPCDVR
jgi:hypothetical protein